MSVCVASDEELRSLCVQTLAVHHNPARGGFDGEKIASLFQAIRIAQHAAYAYSYGEVIDLPAMEFPTSAPPQAILDPPALKDLYEDLGNLGYNTFDQRQNGWLPTGMARLLNDVRTRTAAKAARF